MPGISSRPRSRHRVHAYALLILAIGVSLGDAGCGSMLPAVAEVPVQDTSDWRVPAPEWDLLQRELLRCRRHVDRLGKRYGAQREAFVAYNTLTALSGVTGASAAISGVLQVAGADGATVNKALGIAGAVLAAGGPIVFTILSNQQNPADVRANFEKLNAAYVAALRGRTTVLYCQTLLARTPEVVAPPGSSYPPEILADRGRFQENCSSYYGGTTTTESAAAPQQEPTPKGEDGVQIRRRRARQIIDPEYQLTKLTEQLRQQCAENIPQAATLLSPSKQ